MPIPRAVALAALIVLAGCGGITGQPIGDTPDSRETITPAPVPSPQPTPEPDPNELGPGLETTGVVEPITLGDAHVNALANRSYTASYTVVRTRRDGSISLRYSRRARLTADRSAYCYQTRLTVNRATQDQAIDRRVQEWSNGSHGFRAVEEANQTRYRVVTPTEEGPEQVELGIPYDPTHRRGLVNLFDQVNTTVTGRTTLDGTTVYQVTYPGSPPLDPVGNLSLDARIADTGLVHFYQIEYDIMRQSGLVNTVGTLEYTHIGATTVQQPPWADRARANHTVNRTDLGERPLKPWC